MDAVEDDQADAELEARLRRLESDLADESRLSECERTLKTLERFQDQLTKESRARLMAARRKFALKRLEFLSKAALADERAADGDLEAALRTYDATMRETRDVLKRHLPAKGSDGKPIAPDPFIECYRALIQRSDDLVQRLIVPAYVKAVPPRDMLSTRERKTWGGSSYGVRGEWTDDALIVSHLPRDDGREAFGIFSLDGWTVEWSDYVFDLEFTILAGGFDLLLRYRPDGYPFYATSFKDGAAGYEKDQTYRMTIKVIGSTLTVEMADQASSSDRLLAAVSRTGGIGIGVGPGSKVAIKALKLKVLRPRGGQ